MDAAKWDHIRQNKEKARAMLKGLRMSPAYLKEHWGDLSRDEQKKITKGLEKKGSGWFESQVPVVTKKGIKHKAPEHRKAAVRAKHKKTLDVPMVPAPDEKPKKYPQIHRTPKPKPDKKVAVEKIKQVRKPAPKDLYLQAISILNHNPIKEQEIDYYAGLSKREPFGYSNEVWKKAFRQVAEDGNIMVINNQKSIITDPIKRNGVVINKKWIEHELASKEVAQEIANTMFNEKESLLKLSSLVHSESEYVKKKIKKIIKDMDGDVNITDLPIILNSAKHRDKMITLIHKPDANFKKPMELSNPPISIQHESKYREEVEKRLKTEGWKYTQKKIKETSYWGDDLNIVVYLPYKNSFWSEEDFKENDFEFFKLSGAYSKKKWSEEDIQYTPMYSIDTNYILLIINSLYGEYQNDVMGKTIIGFSKKWSDSGFPAMIIVPYKNDYLRFAIAPRISSEHLDLTDAIKNIPLETTIYDIRSGDFITTGEWFQRYEKYWRRVLKIK